MHALYVLSTFLHILAAITWFGGMAFLVLVVVPWMRSGAQVEAGRFLRETGVRFRNVGWVCFGVLLVTGTFNLHVRGMHVADLFSTAWLSSRYGTLVAVKLGLFATVLAVSAVHDFVVGPKATNAITANPTSAEAQRLRGLASRLGRLNFVLALVLVLVAVMIVRGAPF